jgi:hypothetical protein
MNDYSKKAIKPTGVQPVYGLNQVSDNSQGVEKGAGGSPKTGGVRGMATKGASLLGRAITAPAGFLFHEVGGRLGVALHEIGVRAFQPFKTARFEHQMHGLNKEQKEAYNNFRAKFTVTYAQIKDNVQVGKDKKWDAGKFKEKLEGLAEKMFPDDDNAHLHLATLIKNDPKLEHVRNNSNFQSMKAFSQGLEGLRLESLATLKNTYEFDTLLNETKGTPQLNKDIKDTKALGKFLADLEAKVAKLENNKDKKGAIAALSEGLSRLKGNFMGLISGLKISKKEKEELAKVVDENASLYEGELKEVAINPTLRERFFQGLNSFFSGILNGS